MKKFTADFETTVNSEKVRVWAYALCEIGNTSNFIYGNNIEDFIKFCSGRENYILYFHNLKFDSEFIFSYLLNNGYECIKDKKMKKDKTFTCLISDMGQFYSLEIYFKVYNNKHVNKVTIYDSLKLLNFSVDKIAKEFNLPIRKLEIDYKAYRGEDHKLTEEEIDYIRNDVEIMSRALEILFSEDLKNMTIGGCALNYYRTNTNNFNRYYPELKFDIDQDIRKSYKGGFTYLNPLYKNKEVNNGIVLDVNSLYPSVMYNCLLPFGDPIYFKGEYKWDMLHPLYIQRISCSFELKEGKIPTIQIRNDFDFIPNEYLESSNGDIVTMTLTNIDLKLFFEQYNVKDLVYDGGWKFKGIKGLFNDYIDIWSNKKIEAKKEGNNALYTISKLMMNSLYGKFSKNPKSRSKIPFLTEEGIINYKMLPQEIGKGLYIPTGVFITSYGREKTIRTSQKIRDYTLRKYGEDYYIYSDTDSIHMKELSSDELKKFVEVDDYILGYWKLENKFRKGKYLRQKCYIEELQFTKEEYQKIIEKDPSKKDNFYYEDGYYYSLNVTVAGLPSKLHKYVDFENFETGFSVLASENEKDHKLTYKHVKGGVLLEDIDFTIK